MKVSNEAVKNLIQDTKKELEEQRLKLHNPNTIIEHYDESVSEIPNPIQEEQKKEEYSSSYSELMSR